MKNTKRRTSCTIESRHTQTANGSRVTTRFLSCGHAQVEPRGGRAKHATYAFCDECDAEKAFAAAASASEERGAS